jgi:hypothetical protein
VSFESFPLCISVQHLYISATRASSHCFGLHHAVVPTLRFVYDISEHFLRAHISLANERKKRMVEGRKKEMKEREGKKAQKERKKE